MYTPIVTGADITKVDIGKPSETSTDYAVNITLNAEGAKASRTPRRSLRPRRARSSSSWTTRCSPLPPSSPRSPTATCRSRAGTRSTRPRRCRPVLESGSLPVSFEYAQSQTVGPTLGQDALASGVLVALIGLAVVMLYLLFFYRGLGSITAAAMGIFAVLYLGHPGHALGVRPVQPLARRHRGHRADHRHGRGRERPHL